MLEPCSAPLPTFAMGGSITSRVVVHQSNQVPRLAQAVVHYSSPTSSMIEFDVTVVGASGLPLQGICKRKPNAFVKLVAGADTSPRQTSVIKRSTTPTWGTTFPLLRLDASSELSFKVIHGSFKHKIIGVKVLKISELLELQKNIGNSDVELKLPTGSITIRVRQKDDSSVTNLTHSQEKVGVVPLLLPYIPSPDSAVIQSLGVITKSLEKLRRLMGIADIFAPIHLYINAAFTALETISLVYKVIRRRLDHDTRILGLISEMETVYSVVYPLEPMNERHKALGSILQQILKQTVECALFIQEYTGQGFARMPTRNSADAKIEQFRKSFADLGKSFNTGIEVQIALVSLRTCRGDKSLITLNRLEPVIMNWSGRPLCQPKTCLEVLNAVTDWVTNPSAGQSSVLWLGGVAGSGKSTLSTTIANLFNGVNRLGGYIYFDRDVKERSDPYNVVRTLAYQLGSFDSRIGQEVSRVIEQNPHVTKMHLHAQFHELIRQPLDSAAGLSDEGPIVIVIDALDECSTENHREQLLTLLAEETAQLPRFIRIIITSRVNPDIKLAFQNQSHVHSQEVLLDNEDVSLFIQDQTAKIAKNHSLASDWPGDQKVSALSKRAAGLFIWASTACKYINEDHPEQRIDEFGLDNVFRDATAELDALYVKILESCGNWEIPRFKNDCCAILGLISVAKDPLSPSAIDQLLSLKSLQVISRLGNVIHFQNSTDPTRILHVSFGEFLSDRLRCNNGPWFIDLVDHNQRLAERCFHHLNLTFGNEFCQLTLEDSRTDQTLEEAVKYACTYWVVHVCDMPNRPDGFDRHLYEFMAKHILHWLEAMSMLGTSRSAPSLLKQLHTWVKDFIPGNLELQELVYDGYRFAESFSDTIAEHPSLVYQTALPFAPVESKIYLKFHHDGLPTVLGGFQKWWSPLLRTLHYTDNKTHSLAFSPDGSKVVSYGDEMVQVWDVETGIEVFPALETEQADRGFATFSPDGSNIWLCSDKGTIHILKTSTGEDVNAVRQEQWTIGPASSRNFNRVAFSPVGSKVVLGSEDGALHIVDVAERKEVFPALKSMPLADNQHGEDMGHSVLFSLSGSRIASGSGDGTIQYWDTKTGKEVAPKVQGGSGPVVRLRFSPDGSRIMSSSSNGIIRTMDSTTGREVHSAQIESPLGFPMAFSLDGLRMASTRPDGSIQIWDVETGKSIGPLLQGQSPPSSVAFSPDGSKLVSRAPRDALRIWDVTPSRKANLEMPNRPSVPDVNSISFSQDGLTIRSGESSQVMRIWDSITGRMVKISPQFAPNNSNTTPGSSVVLVDAETGEEVQRKPDQTRWISRLSVSPKSNMLTCSNYGTVNGQGKAIWRLPLELKHRCSDSRERYIAFGISTGQVFVVYLPIKGPVF